MSKDNHPARADRRVRKVAYTVWEEVAMQGKGPTQHILQRAGCPIHYWLTGPPHRPLVVFTHGISLDHRTFAAQVAAIAQHYRVLSWDVRGHGPSWPMGEPFSIRGAARDLVAILDKIECAQATLVGHSMGGYIAQELAFLFPERVTALVSIGSTCTTMKQPLIMRFGAQVTPLVFRLCPTGLLRWIFQKIASAKPDVQSYVARVSSQVPKKDLVAIWMAITHCYHAEQGYQAHYPLLITYGQYDRLLVPRLLASTWAARDTNGHYVAIPKAGHNAHQDNPVFFNSLLLDFLGKHVPYYG